MSGLARQAVTLLFGRGITRLAQFAAFLILARVLTPAGFGWYGIFTTAVALAATLGSLGLRQSFAYEIGTGHITPGQAAGTALALWPALTVASAAGVFLLVGRDVEGVGLGAAGAIIVLAVAGAMLHTLMQGIFLGRGVIWAFSLSETMPRVLLSIGVAGYAFLASLTLTGALWLQASSFLLPLPFIVWGAIARQGRPATAFHRFKPMVSYGLIFAFNLFLVTLAARLSMFVIESNSGAEAAGQFFAAVRINEMFLEIATALGLVFFSKAVRDADTASTVRRGIAISSWLLWTFMALGAVVALMAPYGVPLLLGQEYADSTSILQILALGLAPTAASKMIYPSLAGTGRPYFGTPVIFISLLTNALLALFLIPTRGADGGAIGLVVGQYVLFLGYALTCHLRLGIPIRHLLIPSLGEVRGGVRTAKEPLPSTLPGKSIGSAK